MAWTLSLRKGDQVKVVAGRDKGKRGRVLAVNQKKGVCTVEHVNLLKRHTRPNPAKQIKGGIVEREGPIHISNLMVVCPSCGKTTRVRHQFLDDGSKLRACHRCGATLSS
ncbi:50S ribosomal protein L24 [Acidobacteriia bacterium AH_259_A11_L15]|nr:50S ribosomal protein L24 [Acidobacteriia bacterium AH_259_A11_L15]